MTESLTQEGVRALIAQAEREAALHDPLGHDVLAGLLRRLAAALSASLPRERHEASWTGTEDDEWGPGCSCGCNGPLEQCPGYQAARALPREDADLDAIEAALASTELPPNYARHQQGLRTLIERTPALLARVRTAEAERDEAREKWEAQSRIIASDLIREAATVVSRRTVETAEEAGPCPWNGKEHEPAQRWDDQRQLYYDRCENCGRDLDADEGTPPAPETAEEWDYGWLHPSDAPERTIPSTTADAAQECARIVGGTFMRKRALRWEPVSADEDRADD